MRTSVHTENNISGRLLLALSLITILPLEPFRFHLVLFSTLVIGAALFFLEKSTIQDVIKLLFAAALAALCAFVQIPEIRTLYDLRDLARWIPVLLLLGTSYVRQDLFSKGFYWIIFFSTVFDVLILLLGFSENIRQRWYEAAVTKDMFEYTNEYYRHIGILGNPNTSSLLYVIFILWLLSLISKSPGGLIRNIGLLLTLLNIVLLTATMSRTGFICLGAALIFFKSKFKFFLIIWLIIILLILFNFGGSHFEVLFGRFADPSGFSSGTGRIELTQEIFNAIYQGNFWFGGGENSSVTDNDYIMLLSRFGVIGGIGFLLIFFGRAAVQAFRFRMDNSLRPQLLVVVFVSSLAGGVIGYPGLLILTLILLRAG
jgi:hypothetical protein